MSEDVEDLGPDPGHELANALGLLDRYGVSVDGLSSNQIIARAELESIRHLDENAHHAPDLVRAREDTLLDEEERAAEVLRDLEAEYREQERALLADAEPDNGTSWSQIALGAYVDGEIVVPEPEFLVRTDGRALIYPGRTHYFIGEPESGKTWAALAAVAHVLSLGLGVLYIDYEDDASTFVHHLRLIGVPVSVLRNGRRLAYVRPEAHLRGEEAISDFVAVTRRVQPALVVLDGVSEAMTLADLKIDSNGDVAKFHAEMPRMWDRSGAAVVLIDHVVKAKDQRGRYALGGGHKLAGVNGAVYKFDVTSPLGKGRDGKVKVTVTKDRLGSVREYAAQGENIGVLHVRPFQVDAVPLDAELEVVIAPLGYVDLAPDDELKGRVLAFIAANPGAITREIRAGVTGSNWDIGIVLEKLVAEEAVTMVKHGNGRRYTAV